MLAGSVSMVAYPMQQMAAFRRTEKRQSYGLRIKASPLITYDRLGLALMAPLTFMSTQQHQLAPLASFFPVQSGHS